MLVLAGLASRNVFTSRGKLYRPCEGCAQGQRERPLTERGGLRGPLRVTVGETTFPVSLRETRAVHPPPRLTSLAWQGSSEVMRTLSGTSKMG